MVSRDKACRTLEQAFLLLSWIRLASVFYREFLSLPLFSQHESMVLVARWQPLDQCHIISGVSPPRWKECLDKHQLIAQTHPFSPQSMMVSRNKACRTLEQAFLLLSWIRLASVFYREFLSLPLFSQHKSMVLVAWWQPLDQCHIWPLSSLLEGVP